MCLAVVGGGDKKSIVLSRPFYIGLTVLDINKRIMYDFDYRYAVSKHGTGINLLMADTNSLLYHTSNS